MAELRLAQETTVLAAARAALDPERAAWQHDIIVSTIIEVLARKGPLTRRELREELTLTLVGQETHPTFLLEALERAKSQDLLLLSEGRKGRQQWSLSEGVKAEALADRQWAELLLEETEKEIEARLLQAFPSDPTIGNRAPKLTKELVRAMVRASRDVFTAVQHSSSPTDLREVRLNLRSVVPELRARVHPTTVADFMAELLLSAASPDELFGDDLLGTIVAGQILHGMVCRDDVQGPMPSALLLLDTSQLLLLASHDAATVEIFESFLTTATKQGCELVVTDRVKREWDGHWEQADVYYRQLSEAYGEGMGEALKLHGHRVLQEYGYARDSGAKSFESWARERRSLERIAREHSLTMLDTAELALDEVFVSAFADGLKDHQEELGRPYIRGLERRTTDGVSAAIVRANRLEAPDSLVPTAWFVANDRSSDQVYKQLASDDFPLVVQASTWLLHFAAFEEGGTADVRARFADRLSEDLILRSFISVASTYTNDEMLELGDLLSPGDEIHHEDVRALFVEGFVNPDAAANDRVKDFARARLLRQSDRVVRNRKIEGVRARAAEQKLSKAEAAISLLEDQVSSGTGESMGLRRALEAVVLVGTLGVLWILATTLSWFQGRVLVVGWLVLGYLVFESVNYVVEREAPRRSRFAAIGITLIVAAAAFYVDKKFEL